MTEPALTRLDVEPSGLAVLTIAAGPLNLYTAELHDAFDAALDRLPADTRALLLQAEGRVVSAGVDVNLFAAQQTPEQAKVLFDRMLELPRRIADLPVPTVFAAHALCLTWAFEVAVACDLIVAAERASFGLVEKVVGLTPTMGGTQRLAARAGVGRAKEFVMTGDRYPASVLHQWGVVNQVLPNEGFDAAARDFAAGLAAGPTRAHAATKRVLDHFGDGGVEAADRAVTSIAADLYRTEDLRNAVRSFLADGPGRATFTGR
ncbi:enoyl-CoA hydratase/isomerase family protein [Micromonospora mirobrigensis]|uniref:Enoyl-CoA hydratase/carnithine racemase n=1 Tax=Micromonospora mirobrigensis TaxID=262898 RepID=A0A1C4W9L9_9ACTN|nr:enoyl-CoA hydratase/isomerase family protein [Micromonospora mirobrigensis]SCE92661.1 Enoyl-CoA hydratase/carnithine racemase [Micromonospora mirobrigensis]